MIFKNLEEKCTYYRSLTDYRLMPNSYVLATVDGRSFSKMVKNKFKKPFDKAFINAMNETAIYLCQQVQGCKLAYAQSDEITLLITDINNGDLFFGGRLNKMHSIIAALATAKFNQVITAYEIGRIAYDTTLIDSERTLYHVKDCIDFVAEAPLYTFDCKVWTVPNANDAFAHFLWRQIDCVRNSMQQAAQTYCSYNELLNKSADEQVEFMKSKVGLDWNNYADDMKYGRFIVSQKKHSTKFIEKLNKTIEFDRSVYAAIPAFPLTEDGAQDKFWGLIPSIENGKD